MPIQAGSPNTVDNWIGWIVERIHLLNQHILYFLLIHSLAFTLARRVAPPAPIQGLPLTSSGAVARRRGPTQVTHHVAEA
jgi:hypothetical protein